jgi:hypothetical protein
MHSRQPAAKTTRKARLRRVCVSAHVLRNQKIKIKTKTMVFQREEKTGVTAFGYVENLRTFVKEANELVSPELPEFKAFEINKLVDDCIANRTVDFRNKFGKSSKEDSALYAILATSKSTSTGEKIIAMYTRQRLEKNWTGIYFLTERLLKNEIYSRRLGLRV